MRFPRSFTAVLALLLAAPMLLAGRGCPDCSPLPVDPGEQAAIEITSMHSLNVVVEPTDVEAYDGLFGDPITPAAPTEDPTDPHRPLIDFRLHEINGSTMEMWVDLKGEFCEQQGWFNNATAVQDSYLYAISRGTGYPKILADSIVLDVAPDGLSATGTVVQAGAVLAELQWEHWSTDPEAFQQLLEDKPWYAHYVANEGQVYRPMGFSYEPVADAGPFVKAIFVEEDQAADNTWDSQAGFVTVTLDQDASPLLTNGDWMQLVPEPVTVPGTLEEFSGSSSFYGKSLWCGAEGSIGSAPPHVGP